ncbi:hypothetical protein ACKS0A_01553 [Histoplasma ohiense]
MSREHRNGQILLCQCTHSCQFYHPELQFVESLQDEKLTVRGSANNGEISELSCATGRVELTIFHPDPLTSQHFTTQIRYWIPPNSPPPTLSYPTTVE